MTEPSAFSEYAAILRGFTRQFSTPCPGLGEQGRELAFNNAALSLFALQFAFNPAYRRLCESQNLVPRQVRHWSEIPAVPAAAFKELEFTSLPADRRTRVFHSSGTTGQRPSRHFHDAESLSLYDAALLPWFKVHLMPDRERARFISLSPAPETASNSSLAHMFGAVHREFGSADSVFTGSLGNDNTWLLDTDQTIAILHEAAAAGTPLILLGTAFNFVQLLDYMEEADVQVQLAGGSRVLETGGYKGRTRSLPKAGLHEFITRKLGVPRSQIVCEYGMSELSSQAYDTVAGGESGPERYFRFPPWARARLVSPETGREVEEGGLGLIRVYDLANMRSVICVQTEDLGVRRGNGLDLLGRATHAEPRGCSLTSV